MRRASRDHRAQGQRIARDHVVRDKELGAAGPRTI
jgi:hypothetical protein